MGCRNRRPAGNERVQLHAQTGDGFFHEAVFNLSGVNQRSVLPLRKIEAAEVRAVVSDTGGQQCLAILARRLDPVPAPRGKVGRIDPLRDDAFDVDLMRLRPDARPPRNARRSGSGQTMFAALYAAAPCAQKSGSRRRSSAS
jgi:hypothetical protein